MFKLLFKLLFLNVLYFMMIWGFAPPVMAERFGSQCGQLEHQFFSAENMTLKNSVYKNKTVADHVICGRDCGLEKDCKSFNFYKCRGFCEFSSATRKEHTEDFVGNLTWMKTQLSYQRMMQHWNASEAVRKGLGKVVLTPSALMGRLTVKIYCEMNTSSVKESTMYYSSIAPPTQYINTQHPTQHSSATEPATPSGAKVGFKKWTAFEQHRLNKSGILQQYLNSPTP